MNDETSIHDDITITLPYWQALALWALMKSPGYRRDTALQNLADAIVRQLEPSVIP